MGRTKGLLTAFAVLLAASMFNSDSGAQTVPSSTATPTPDNAVMLTIFLKHDETVRGRIRKRLQQNSVDHGEHYGSCA